MAEILVLAGARLEASHIEKDNVLLHGLLVLESRPKRQLLEHAIASNSLSAR